eukprot:5445220-Amphidinium_carterae.1
MQQANMGHIPMDLAVFNKSKEGKGQNCHLSSHFCASRLPQRKKETSGETTAKTSRSGKASR